MISCYLGNNWELILLARLVLKDVSISLHRLLLHLLDILRLNL